MNCINGQQHEYIKSFARDTQECKHCGLLKSTIEMDTPASPKSAEWESRFDELKEIEDYNLETTTKDESDRIALTFNRGLNQGVENAKTLATKLLLQQEQKFVEEKSKFIFAEDCDCCKANRQFLP